MPTFICKLDPQTQNTQKHKENQGGGHPFVDILIFLVLLCILGFGVEFAYAYKDQHIISGKHAQALYADFYMPTEASDLLTLNG